MENEKHEIDTSENRHRLEVALYGHVGKFNAISMTDLYEIVFDRPWNDKINDTRALRTLITAMRNDLLDKAEAKDTVLNLVGKGFRIEPKFLAKIIQEIEKENIVK